MTAVAPRSDAVWWGIVAAVLNFIPYIGSATTFGLLTIVAFVSFDGGQVVQPLLVGQRLELNPIIVFLALWFGGWFWGIPGIVLAIPSLVTLKVVAKHNLRGGPLVEFLSPSKKKMIKGFKLADVRPRKAMATRL